MFKKFDLSDYPLLLAIIAIIFCGVSLFIFPTLAIAAVLFSFYACLTNRHIISLLSFPLSLIVITYLLMFSPQKQEVRQKYKHYVHLSIHSLIFYQN